MKNKKNWQKTGISRRAIWEQGKMILKSHRGMGIVEIALIIVVIVALAFIFKQQIFALLDSIFQSINIQDLGSY